ncbi:MAG: hypothetical protein MUO50_12785, partial [Longimicrobiales bacterium]|nr:hypothetical protein [Longimicrobiales bacterium]
MAEVSCSSLPHLSRPTLGLRLGALVLLGYGAVLGAAGCSPPQHSESWAPAAGLKTRFLSSL